MWNQDQLVIITRIFSVLILMSDQPTAESSTFQGIIQTLQNYWSEQGCVMMQPLDMEVGAGTFHPAIFTRDWS